MTLVKAIITLTICFFCGLTLAASDIKFAKKTIKIGSTALNVELADTPEKGAQGLMFRKKLAEGSGMVFIFPSEDYRAFWMKNTFIDLSIAFFDAKKKLIDLQDMKATKSELESDPPTYKSSGPAQYAVEVPKGWFDKHKIKIGDQLSGL